MCLELCATSFAAQAGNIFQVFLIDESNFPYSHLLPTSLQFVFPFFRGGGGDGQLARREEPSLSVGRWSNHELVRSLTFKRLYLVPTAFISGTCT